MNQTIKVYSRSVYGRTLLYSADVTQAKHLQALTGAKTLEHRHLIALEALGFTIQQVPDPASWLAPLGAVESPTLPNPVLTFGNVAKH